MSQDQPSKTKYKFIDKGRTTNYWVLAILAAVILIIGGYVLFVKIIPDIFSPTTSRPMSQQEKQQKEIDDFIKSGTATNAPLSPERQKEINDFIKSGTATSAPLSPERQKEINDFAKQGF